MKTKSYSQKSGYFYIFKINNNTTKFGITNCWNYRLKQHLLKQHKNNKEVKIYYIQPFESMFECLLNESLMIQLLKKWAVQGHREFIREEVNTEFIYHLFTLIHALIKVDVSDPSKANWYKLKGDNIIRLRALILNEMPLLKPIVNGVSIPDKADLFKYFESQWYTKYRQIISKQEDCFSFERTIDLFDPNLFTKLQCFSEQQQWINQGFSTHGGKY